MTELDHLMATALNLAEVVADLSAQAWRGDLAVSHKADGWLAHPTLLSDR
jgi:hypothetical protein